MAKKTPKIVKVEERGKLPTLPYRAVGGSGTAIHSGYVVSKEKHADLQGSRRYVTFSELIANVGIVGAGVRYFLNLIGKVSWKSVPVDHSPEAIKAADFVDDVFEDIQTPWSRIIRRAAMYKFYGFSVQEWIAKKRWDGRIGFLDIEVRPQSTIERWDRDEKTGILRGVIQREVQRYEERYLPLNKLLYVVDDSLSDSPEGLGIARTIVPYAKRLGRYEILEGYGFETDLRGIPIGRVPKAILQQMVEDGKITSTQMIAMEEVLKDFIENHIRSPETGLVLDSLTYQTQDEKGSPSNVKQWDLELIKGGQTALPDMGKAIERNVKQIALLLGVEHLLLGQDRLGSYALSRDKTNNFFLIVDSTLLEVASTVKKDLLPPLFKLNGMNPRLIPTPKPEPVNFRDIEQVSRALESLANAGAPLDPDDEAIDFVREMAGLPTRDEAKIVADASLIPEDDDGTRSRG